MDQLASIGVAFKDDYINRIFDQNVQYYENAPEKSSSIFSLSRPWKQWATTPVYDQHKPVRPWGLGEIYESETGIVSMVSLHIYNWSDWARGLRLYN